MKRIVSAIFLTLILTTSCKADTFHMYKDEISELLQDPKTRTFKGGDGDVNDLNDCQFMLEVGDWELSRSKWGNFWGRHESWQKGTMYHGSGVSLDHSTKYFKNIKMALNDKLTHIIYIGPWHPITLTHTEGSFFNSKKITEQKQIRFFAYSGIGGGNIQYQYESMTEENKNIPEKEFSLSPTAKYAPDKFGLCVVKWTAKFGYNAIAEVKSRNPFSKNYLVPTGKVIEAKE
jgi:hypothetical protein